MNKWIYAGVVLALLAGIAWWVVSPTISTTSADQRVVVKKMNNYMDEFVQERKNLEFNFSPSPIKKHYVGHSVSFWYPENFIATSTDALNRSIIIVTPPKIYEIASHLETEFYLPALTIEFHTGMSSQALFDKEYAEYRSTAKEVIRNGRSVTQIGVINGFDGSEFTVELFDTPHGVITANYLSEPFSRNFSTVLDSIQSQ